MSVPSLPPSVQVFPGFGFSKPLASLTTSSLTSSWLLPPALTTVFLRCPTPAVEYELRPLEDLSPLKLAQTPELIWLKQIWP